jgi:uncharacterized membrane protein YeaQ/YmgE (transglycosylase-associated protein family)
MLLLIVGLALGGLIIGALGRLVVPGPNPMGIWRTIAVGLAGSFIGGVLGRAVFGLRYRYSLGLALVLAVACTAALVYLFDGRRRARRYR